MDGLEYYEIECFWCDTVFDGSHFDRCPKCSSDLQTREIQIIEEGEE